MANGYNNDSISIDSELIETIIGLNTKFKGSVKTDKVLRIDGEFEGEIESTTVMSRARRHAPSFSA